MNERKKIAFDEIEKRWLRNQYATEPTSTEQLSSAIIDVYLALQKAPPKIFYYRSPIECMESLSEKKGQPFSLMPYIRTLKKQLPTIRSTFPSKQSVSRRFFKPRYSIHIPYKSHLYQRYQPFLSYAFHPSIFLGYIIWIDFCVSELGVSCDKNLWLPLRTISEYACYVFFYDDYCYVSERPSFVSLNKFGLPHADGKASVEYADQFKAYFYNGMWMPPQYGTIRSVDWKAKWLLCEKDEAIRQTLAKGIGLERIKSELYLQEKDAWGQYTLYRLGTRGESASFILLLTRRRADKREDYLVVESKRYIRHHLERWMEDRLR